MSIPTRHVPALGRTVGAIGLGCMGISWAYSGADASSDTAGAPILAHALASGIDFFDTSDAYAAGHNERVVGRALAGTDAVIATKAGLIGNDDDGGPVLTRNGTPEHLAQACDSSLRNLGVDTIDLYYLHRVDDQVPIEDSWGALSELVAAGKVRALGLSEVTVEQARVAHSIHPVAAVQSELSLWTRNALGQGTTHDGEPVGNMVEWTGRTTRCSCRSPRWVEDSSPVHSTPPHFRRPTCGWHFPDSPELRPNRTGRSSKSSLRLHRGTTPPLPQWHWHGCSPKVPT